MQSAYELVWMSAERAPDQVAVVDDLSGRRLGYRELLTEVEVVAAGLHELGVREGMRVATVLPNGLPHVLALLALQRLGAVTALLDPRLKAGSLARIVRRARMATAVALDEFALVEALRDALPGDPPLVTDLSACRASPDRLPPFARPRPEQPAFIFYTSGTTGDPKGVVVPHRATEPRVLFTATQGGLGFGAHNRVLGLMPLYHVVGFYGVLLMALAFNGTYFMVSRFDPEAAVRTIRREGITSLFASPSHFHALVKAPGASAEALASLRSLLYAGATMPEPLQRRVRALTSATVVNIYGTTETMNSLYLPDPIERPRTLRPGFASRARVVRLGGGVDDLAPRGEVGELLVAADVDATFLCYLDDPEATARKVAGGWYRTGDLGCVDDEGDFVLSGRVDDVIISGAENVNGAEVEEVLTAHPGVGEVAVIGLPDERLGEVVTACVVLADPGVTAADLDAHCRGSLLANFKRPRSYVFLEELPRNAARKVLKRVLRAELADRPGGTALRDDPAASAGPSDRRAPA